MISHLFVDREERLALYRRESKILESKFQDLHELFGKFIFHFIFVSVLIYDQIFNRIFGFSTLLFFFFPFHYFSYFSIFLFLSFTLICFSQDLNLTKFQKIRKSSYTEIMPKMKKIIRKKIIREKIIYKIKIKKIQWKKILEFLVKIKKIKII